MQEVGKGFLGHVVLGGVGLQGDVWAAVLHTIVGSAVWLNRVGEWGKWGGTLTLRWNTDRQLGWALMEAVWGWGMWVHI